MAHVPGQVVALKDDAWGTTCEEHPDVPAIKRICSEADSFGAEYMNFCQPCWDNYQQGLKEKEEDPEQWDTCSECKKKAPRLISYRDMDEGMHGPVYEHCEECHSKMNARIAEEDAFYDDGDDDYYPEPDYEPQPEPHYEDVSEDELQFVADYLKRQYELPFTVKKKDKKTGESELSLILEVRGTKAYKRANRRFNSFKNIDVSNGLIDVMEVKEAVCGSADDIDVTILNRCTHNRKIEGNRRNPLTMTELMAIARSKLKTKRRIAKEFITPVYTIELILSKVYWS